jgi:hypothetical protein
VPILVVLLDIEVDDRAGRNPCFVRMTATPVGAVSLLGGVVTALMVFLTSSIGGNPRPDWSHRRRRHHSVVPFLKASPWLLVESV